MRTSSLVLIKKYLASKSHMIFTEEYGILSSCELFLAKKQFQICHLCRMVLPFLWDRFTRWVWNFLHIFLQSYIYTASIRNKKVRKLLSYHLKYAKWRCSRWQYLCGVSLICSKIQYYTHTLDFFFWSWKVWILNIRFNTQ